MEKGRKKRSRGEKRKYFFNERRERSLIKYIYFLASYYNAQPFNFSYGTTTTTYILSIRGAKNSNIAI